MGPDVWFGLWKHHVDELKECPMAELVVTPALSADHTVQDRQRYIAQIENRYSLGDRGAVWQFLFAHPDLAPVLLTAYDLLQEHLPEAHVELRVVQEPEVPHWSQLHAAVRTSLPVDQALDLLERLEEDWFERQPNWVDDLFVFDVECGG
jgi:hypothetical protein